LKDEQSGLDNDAAFLKVLKERFDKNMSRHVKIEWYDIEQRLLNDENKLKVLFEMESTGGEPDVVSYDSIDDSYLFVDCSSETPIGRRSLCYDRAALNGRKKNRPANSALDMARSMGVKILDEELYREIQKKGIYDTKTSSWIETPQSIRKLGGALFCDRRYDCVFTYHNGADSYYRTRGFRAVLRV
jgi:hypothetical protein